MAERTSSADESESTVFNMIEAETGRPVDAPAVEWHLREVCRILAGREATSSSVADEEPLSVADETEAAEILARVDRALAVAEDRADRLLRQYGLA